VVEIALKIMLGLAGVLVALYIVAFVLFSLGSGVDREINRPVSPAQAHHR
jgi:hypothetical protein